MLASGTVHTERLPNSDRWLPVTIKRHRTRAVAGAWRPGRSPGGHGSPTLPRAGRGRQTGSSPAATPRGPQMRAKGEAGRNSCLRGPETGGARHQNGLFRLGDAGPRQATKRADAGPAVSSAQAPALTFRGRLWQVPFVLGSL
jgi:hypothetical protein